MNGDGHLTDALFTPLPGPRQSIDTAEIYAGVVALWFALGAVTLCSDSQMFVDGWLAGEAWCVAAERPNADTWRSFWAAVGEIGVSNVEARKVNAHTTEADVASGTITKEDRYGNAWADELAKRGARSHRAPLAARTRAADLSSACRRIAGWTARGLALAADVLALPPRVSAQDRAERAAQRGRKTRPLKVEADATWRAMEGARRMAFQLHPSHHLWALPGLLFCTLCGAYSSGAVRLLGSACAGCASTQMKTWLTRLRGGLHPRNGQHIGAPQRVDLLSLRAETTARAWLRPG